MFACSSEFWKSFSDLIVSFCFNFSHLSQKITDQSERFERIFRTINARLDRCFTLSARFDSIIPKKIVAIGRARQNTKTPAGVRTPLAQIRDDLNVYRTPDGRKRPPFICSGNKPRVVREMPTSYRKPDRKVII